MEILGLIEEAAGISLYQNKKESTMALIKKKDNKLQEINTILENEVNPQLEKLRQDKETYAVFKSNESQIEDLDKILTAYEYYELDRLISNEDLSQYKERERKIRVDIECKLQEIQQLKLTI